MPPLTLFHVDAFTRQPFGGNQAAVCLLPVPRDATWMQLVAAEMNLAETAFLVRRSDGFDLRWFAPSAEVDLCGHATLGSAHALWESGEAPLDEPITFHTRSGPLICRASQDWILMDFPATPAVQAEPASGLLEALGAQAKWVGRTKHDYLIEVEDEAALRALAPDFNRLVAVSTRGAIVTSRSADNRYDFVSRFFAPAVGINEDPATGSSHCALGPYWQEKLGKSEFVALQASRREGVVRVRVEGNRITLGGQAVSVLRCELLI